MFAFPDSTPVLAPIDPNAPIDPVALLHDVVEVWKDWKTGGTIAGLTALVYLLTLISKNTWLLKQIPSYWRPYVALALGVVTGTASSLAGGAHFWPGAVFAGVAAGAGSIAFDQLLTQWKAGALARMQKKSAAVYAANGGGGGTGPHIVVALLVLGLGGAARADTTPAATKPPAVVAALPQVAASDEPTPPPPLPVTASQFGGCTKSGLFCFGPSIEVGLLAINLTSGTVEGSFIPGAGYGVTVYPGQWYSVGAAISGDVNPAAQQASAALLLKLVNGYIRIGVSKGFIGDHSWRIPIGLGVDL